MAVVVDFSGSLATLQGGEWQGEDEELIDLLTEWTRTSIDTAVSSDDLFLTCILPAIPIPTKQLQKLLPNIGKGKL